MYKSRRDRRITNREYELVMEVKFISQEEIEELRMMVECDGCKYLPLGTQDHPCNKCSGTNNYWVRVLSKEEEEAERIEQRSW